MKTIATHESYPNGAEYAMLTKDGVAIQGFYKEVEDRYNDGTTVKRLYHKSSLPVWSPSWYTLPQLLTQPFEIVSII